jgi:hypothetical protein
MIPLWLTIRRDAPNTPGGKDIASEVIKHSYAADLWALLTIES